MTARKPILCLDFDGVIHSYSSGWKGATIIPDPPVPGAIDFILRALDHFTVAIFSSRSGQPGGIEAMRAWLVHHAEAHFEQSSAQRTQGALALAHDLVQAIQWPTEKPPAVVTLDDRAVTFTGTFPSLDELRAFQPWNKRSDEDRELERQSRVVTLGGTVTPVATVVDDRPRSLTVHDVLLAGFEALGLGGTAEWAANATLFRQADALR